ncbi:MAG: DUF1896 domain-containing protein [Chitinophagaceae bacterium]|nr:DUF1896 domain-containing protein [Chitinophagaceae bacterium]
MDTRNKDLSYFTLRLQEVLNTSFPEKAHDKRFIEQRSGWAAKTYENAFLSGSSVEECDYIANDILFEGLHFSRFDTIFQVVCNEFDTIMAEEELHPFALSMLPVCESIFGGYELTDDFAFTTEYELLYTEITGTITLYIEEHGI